MPLIYRPLQIGKECLRVQERGEWIRLSDVILADMKTELYAKEYVWEEMPKKGGKVLKLSDLSILPSWGGTRKITVKRELLCRSIERETDGKDVRILVLRITFLPFYHTSKDPKKSRKLPNVFEHKLMVIKEVVEQTEPQKTGSPNPEAPKPVVKPGKQAKKV
jgi:hypothetical protein